MDDSDQDFLDRIENKVMYTMFSGCAMDDHLGYEKYDVGSWAMNLRADEVCRLLDLAKRGADA